MEFILICISVIIVAGFATTAFFLVCTNKRVDLISQNDQITTKIVNGIRDVQQSKIQIMMSPYLNSLGVPDERLCVPIKQNELLRYNNSLIVVKDVREHRLLVGVVSGEHTIIPAAVYGEYGQWTRKYLAVSEPYLVQDFDHIYALIPPK